MYHFSHISVSINKASLDIAFKLKKIFQLLIMEHTIILDYGCCFFVFCFIPLNTILYNKNIYWIVLNKYVV